MSQPIIRQSGKLKEIVGIGQPAIKEALPKKCYNCKKILFDKYYSCKYVYFCGKECQLRSWIHHKTICTSIATLHDQHKEKTYKSGSYSTNLTPKEKNKVVELIGDKCLIQCRLNKREASVLLDTGPQVSIFSEDYMQQNHPDAEIKHISHILDEPDSMRVQWGNQADIPFNSFTVMKLNVGDEGVHCHVDDHIHHPIVGFNAIRHIAKESSDVNFLNRLLEKAFNNTDISKIEAFFNLIQSQEQQKVVEKIKGKDCII